ncbi:uromodulin isoform X1 [Podarcis muralis]
MKHPFNLLLFLVSLRCSTFAQTTRLVNATVQCSDCHPNATCEENGDLRQCICQDGFTGDGATCSDVDECSSHGLNHCHSLATCINAHGNYSCSCPEGYDGDGFHCKPAGFAEECVGLNGSRSCSDPCSSHTVLDQPWRSTSYGAGSNCDSDKKGWYRFVGSGGERMPESCVPINRCNTAAPMWLNGLHPTRNDEIVTRTACADWSGNCCHWSIPVQIKACVGGYYVYQFQGTPNCALTYCTDPAYVESLCHGCSAEECKLINGEWGCACSSDASNLEPQLECGANEIKVSMANCTLNSFQNLTMHLRDNRCAGFVEQGNRTVVSVVTPTQAGQCGTLLTKNETHATYSNTLYLADGTVIRENEIKINFLCSYPLDMETSLRTAIQPIVSSTNISIEGAGQFIIKMALYRDQNYTSPYEGAMAVLPTQTWLYVGVMVTNGDVSSFVLLMDNCFATPTEDTADPLKYFIIQNSCPNRRDASITVPENGVSAQGRFSLQVFKFVGNHNLVYLHCEVRLCDPSAGPCRPRCAGIESRQAAAAVAKGYFLDVGPIARQGFEHLAGAAAPQGLQGAWVTVLMSAVLVFSIHPFA